MDRLTPEQVGRLASHIKEAIERNPNRPPEKMSEEELQKSLEPDGMEEWERDLQLAVDADEALPDYDEIKEEGIVEYLVGYYAPEWDEELP